MKAQQEFWELVDAAFDARRDPLDDPNVQRLLADDPSLLDELARLRERLSGVDAEPRKPRIRRVVVVGKSAAFAMFVAAAAASVVVWVVLSSREKNSPTHERESTPVVESEPPPEPSHDAGATPDDEIDRNRSAEALAANGALRETDLSITAPPTELALTPRIFSFRCESSHRDARGIRTIVFDGRTRTESFLSFERPSDRSAPYISAFLAAASSFSNGN